MKSESISNFVTMFNKGCRTPKAYEELKRDFQQTSSGADARANQLLRPQRTMFEVFGTDVAAYEIYYPDACNRAARMNQCSPAKTLNPNKPATAAPGTWVTQTGAGAGEVVAGGNRSVAVNACQAAADTASGPLKALYLAQLGRAQMYGPSGTFDGAKTLMQAIAAGYPGAEVDIARAHIRDVEFGGVAVDDLKVALSHFAKGRSAGARETATVVNPPSKSRPSRSGMPP